MLEMTKSESEDRGVKIRDLDVGDVVFVPDQTVAPVKVVRKNLRSDGSVDFVALQVQRKTPSGQEPQPFIFDETEALDREVEQIT